MKRNSAMASAGPRRGGQCARWVLVFCRCCRWRDWSRMWRHRRRTARSPCSEASMQIGHSLPSPLKTVTRAAAGAAASSRWIRKGFCPTLRGPS
eukprot:9047576-Pyramimonas_sp.AAC.1